LDCFTFWIVNEIIALGPKDIPRLQEVGVDSIVSVFSLLVTVATAFLFGVVPAWRISRTDLNSALKEEGGPNWHDRTTATAQSGNFGYWSGRVSVRPPHGNRAFRQEFSNDSGCSAGVQA
jgi:hypothetical protein